MAILPPPSPAWRPTLGGALTTTVLPHMRRGYIPTRPTGAEVFGVAGVPSDASVPAGTTIAYDTTNKRLYRRLHDGWYSVNGDGAVGAVGLFLYPSASLYPSTSLYPGEQ